MGDRVLFQVVGCGDDVSPVVYGHWSGSDVPLILEKLANRMRGREEDVDYTAARLVQEVCQGSNLYGNTSVGIWNVASKLTESDSQGDAGVVLIYLSASGMTFKTMGGYLKASADGRSVSIEE